jgi:predicted DCC family thiol-disulfide oxidoreductase YuxK
MTPELERACGRAVHLIRNNGEVYRAGRAVLMVLGSLGWRRSSRILSLPPMIWLVELVYWLVATNRQLFGRYLFRNESL